MDYFALDLLSTRVGLAATCGFASHVLYFIRGEHHMKAPLLFVAYFVGCILVFLLELRASDYGVYSAIWPSTLIVVSYTLSLFGSMVAYRTVFHPLCSFPGPIPARITKLWHMQKSLVRQNHLLMEKLHEQYGDFVRTGKF